MAKRKAYRPPAGFPQQPKPARVLKLISRKRGMTAAEGAKVLGWNTPSIHAVIVRLRQCGVEIVGQWDVKRAGNVYRAVDRFTGAKDRTRLTKAQTAKLAAQGGFRAPKVSK